MNELPVCTQCGFTHAEFRARGLLGCPACYDQLGEALFADLLQLHPLLHREPFTADTRQEADDIARLREMLADALRDERYEDASVLRRRIADTTRRDPPA